MNPRFMDDAALRRAHDALRRANISLLTPAEARLMHALKREINWRDRNRARHTAKLRRGA